jgi:O-antigen ligase
VEADGKTLHRRRLLRPGWVLYVAFVGFPIWWILGMAGFVWPIVAVPMLLSLLRRGRIYAPPGFLIWCLFLLWMLASGVQIDSLGRALGFSYRAAIYVSATILLLYVFNSSRDVLESKRVIWVACIFWIYVVIGGFLGLIMPDFSFKSPVEAFLPGVILSNDFVKEMVHPAFAQVQDFLGFPTPRPSAPFVYTNDWGGAFALLVPFVVIAWGSALSRRFKMILAVTALASVVPIVSSLNRGLWLSLGVGLAYAAFRLAMRGRERAMVGFFVVSVIVTAAVLFTPLKQTIEERISTPHSNDRRTSLYEEAIRGTAESPLFGYGAPRPSKWNPNAPSVGTQGQIWLVLFSNGFPGAALFLASFAIPFWRFRRVGSDAGFWIHVMLLIMFIQLPVYGLLPAQLNIVMLGIAVAWRDRREPQVQTVPMEVQQREKALAS